MDTLNITQILCARGLKRGDIVADVEAATGGGAVEVPW